MSEEIDRLKKEYEEKYTEYDKFLTEKLALNNEDFQQNYDRLKVQQLELKRELAERSAKYQDAMQASYKRIIDGRVVTVGDVEKMIAESESRILDIIRKSYGG